MTGNRDDITPETVNSEQQDAAAQAQSVTADALARSTSVLGLAQSARQPGGLEPAQAQDLVDHMNQMVTSGVIDLSAYSGEEPMDDLENRYGEASVINQGVTGDDS